MSEDLRVDEEICLGLEENNPLGSMTPPIFQTSLFSRSSLSELMRGLAAEDTEPVYTRGRNPTVEALESKMARLERGEAAICFGSGMAAVSAVFLGLLQQGDHILFANHIYGPTLELASHLESFGIEHEVTFEIDIPDIERRIRPATRMIYFESPGTMLFRELPIPELVGLARSRGLWTVIDNSWATPLFQKPLPMGVDIVLHSCSKYLGGHSDAMGGVVVSRADLIRRIFYKAFMLNGGILAPETAWLLNRGLRTLPLRMAGHQRGGLRVAEFLRDHPAVREVFHPALAGAGSGSPLRGYSGLFSFELRESSFPYLVRVVDSLRKFRKGVSWGGVESLVITPNRGTNLDSLRAQGIPSGLVRVSVGLEDPDALIQDLERALAG